jgi:hypothetical protein
MDCMVDVAVRFELLSGIEGGLMTLGFFEHDLS